jgi:kynurenine formamidase
VIIVKIDLSVAVTREMIEKMKVFVPQNKTLSELDLFGHLGTHFDIVEHEFDTRNFERRGRVFDVSGIESGEIRSGRVELSGVIEGDFVIFYTGSLGKKGYGTKEYFSSHPELSWDLIERLVDLKVSMIGVDAGGIRMIQDHPKADRFCASHGAFVVENMDNLALLAKEAGDTYFKVSTYPMNFTGTTGLPCRVVAETGLGKLN